MKRLVRSALVVTGGLLLVLMMISGYMALTAFMERAAHGPGILFMDVEFFALIALTCGIAGAAALWLARHLKEPPRTERTSAG